MGGLPDRFPLTRGSVIEAVKGSDAAARERALDSLVAAYWKPVYKYIRLKWNANNEEGKDFTQGFFASAMERGFFARYAEQKASFRTYLRMCVDGFVANERRAAKRLKRGGERRVLSLDFASADTEYSGTEPAAGGDTEGYFDRECLRSLFDRAARELQDECGRSGKQIHFQLFERYDLRPAGGSGRPTYEELAVECRLPATQVTNHLAWARRTFRRNVLAALREITGSEAEYRDEARRLLGMDV